VKNILIDRILLKNVFSTVALFQAICPKKREILYFEPGWAN
jgi:hypothetical protein